MIKTYWWRIIILLAVLFFVVADYFTYCEMSMRRCFWNGDIYILRTIFHLSVPILISSIILFLTSDNIFKKWIKFAIGWIFVSLIAIAATPEYGGGFLDPDREQVSIWMSSLFLIISIILMIVWSVKERNKK